MDYVQADRQTRAHQILYRLLADVPRDKLDKLIKELEQEGAPTQITLALKLDTPDTSHSIYLPDAAIQIYGNFDERAIKVTRVPESLPEYEHDISLLEGSYANIKELQARIDGFNALYRRMGDDNSLSKKAREVIQEKFLTQKKYKGQHLSAPIADSLEMPGIIYYSRARMPGLHEVTRVLQMQGIEHLTHNIVAEHSGLYDTDWSIGPHGDRGHHIKVADISLKLL